ncbi:hypothetical protein ACMFMG_004054 [Clarireedia jacksonii]
MCVGGIGDDENDMEKIERKCKAEGEYGTRKKKLDRWGYELFFVETKGRTLEELTEIFNAAKPVKYSLKKSEVVIHDGEGVGVEEVFDEKEEKEAGLGKDDEGTMG